MSDYRVEVEFLTEDAHWHGFNGEWQDRAEVERDAKLIAERMPNSKIRITQRTSQISRELFHEGS